MKIFREVFYFIFFEIIFCSILGVILVFHGPFVNIKEIFVTSAMTTMKHQYLARLFVTQDEIDSIMKKNQSDIKNGIEHTSDIITSSISNEVNIINIDAGRFKGYLMIVDNPSRVIVGSPDKIGQNGMTLSQIVKKYNAIGGINAGGFRDAIGTGTGGIPDGIIVENYNVKYSDGSKSYDIIGFNSHNILVIGSYTLNEIKNYGIRDAVCFGPPLIINGKPMIVKGNGGWGIQPRTAIGQKKDGTILLLVIDGRQVGSLGATLKDEQDVLLKYGAYNAANLDGGSSTTMYYDNKIVNKPADILGERYIASAFIIK